MLERINPSELDLKEKIVHINRVAKVIKGGRRFSFNATVVVGDRNGYIGTGMGKANEVTDAIAKATESAKKNIIRIKLNGNTIPHSVLGKFNAGKVFLMPASPGTGIIAGGAARSILEACGIKDVFAKSHGSSNKHNLVKATLRALNSLLDLTEVAKKRDLTPRQVFEL
ncbi:30S ribosomal protein S5 [bacterium]|nr:30S ribosomal protein S5 [bacterium]